MRYASPLLFALILLLAGRPLTGSAQAIAQEKLTNKLSVLNERAFFSFPQAAVSSARPTDIMSADHNTNQETRIVLDRQKMRLVFFAQELYAVGDKSLLTRVLTEANGKAETKTKVLADTPQTFAVLSTPTRFDSSADAILVNSLLVRTGDNAIFKISAYINPDAYAKRAEFGTLAERVFQSLQAGPRLSSRSAHVETLDLFASPKKFKISLPADYAVTVDQKYDFQVFKFHHYSSFGSEERRMFIVYVGSHPSYLYRNFDLRKDQAKEVEGKFLGQPIRWLTFADPGKKIYIKEQQVAGTQIAERLILHVGMLSDDAAALDEMSKIVAAIELTN